MKQILLAFLLTSIATAASARITYEPVAPVNGDVVTITVSGIWSDGCVPHYRTVQRDGTAIRIELATPVADACTLALTPFRASARIDVPQPGVYEVVVIVDDRGRVRELERDELLVAERDPAFRVVPPVVRHTGGTPIELVSADGFPQNPVVRIGGVAVDAVAIDARRLRVTPPAHAPGVVDVAVNGAVVRSALRYYDPAEPADRESFATILIPLALNRVPGALGSLWSTHIRMRNNSDAAFASANDLSIAACPPITTPPFGCDLYTGPSETRTFASANRPRGALFQVPRSVADQLTFTATVLDESRQAISLGAELPIVREDEFRTAPLEFVDVPLRADYRLTLRVYALDVAGEAPVAVEMFDAESNRLVGSTTARLTRQAHDEAAFVQLDSALPHPNGVSRVRVRVGSSGVTPIWAFLSITNNDTQQVTILTPQ
ncbi:MAG TPA: hypothetical protein VF698_18685 [Thermoanaerobaculia bacterium]